MTLTPGTLLSGRYQLVRERGRGGMAEIWEAEDTLLGRRVAIKALHPPLAANADFATRFRQEARTAAALAHPNVVSIFDVGTDEGAHTPYLVMELVEGESLRDLLQREAPLPEPRIRELGAGIAEALEVAHRRGLVHRDVKPSNVLLDAEGRPKLADFGIAQAVQGGERERLTGTNLVLGSVHYLAPEVARGEPASAAADVYGLGAVLYEMATGRPPFTGETDMAVALAHVERPPVPPRDLNPRVSAGLAETILRALAKRPAERFASAAELAGALRAPERWASADRAGASAPTRAMPVPIPPAAPHSRAAPPPRATRPATPARTAPAPRAAPAYQSVRSPRGSRVVPPPIPPRAERPPPPRGVGMPIPFTLLAAVIVLGVAVFVFRALLEAGPSVTPVMPPAVAPTLPPAAPAVVPTRPPAAQPAPEPEATAPEAVAPVEQPGAVAPAQPTADPAAAIRRHYQLIDARQFDAGYQIMSERLRTLNPLAEYRGWFANKVALQPVSVEVVAREGNRAVVEAVVDTTDRVDGQVVQQRVAERFDLVFEDGAWRIDEVTRL